MKKYACNRLYFNNGEYISTAVVTINEMGEVESHTRLVEETSATEWIGGAIILSDKKEINIKSTFKQLLLDTKCATHPMYAWHIIPFDFAKEELSEQSIIKRLHPGV